MRSNERDMSVVAAQRADLEGRLSHKSPRSALRDDRPRERWFKLRHNLLFYYRLNEHGGVSEDEGPAGLFVLENCHVQPEPFAADLSFCFSVTLNSDPERRHLFACVSAAAVAQWVDALRAASYEARNVASREEERLGGRAGAGARTATFYSHLVTPSLLD
ncbi:pleckstrin homology domain-containing family J member 1-like [Pollicipes pollicipes]|uniref:pleckstrin homology domain-containing family J member 1-like n=1 Tax=Pollicipes pollicipes TaxID=41117 RepID=UPI001884A517|nr:pleckstrin homology domain-containing family J member 1-like [Pollicipes pollicipes]